MLEDRMDGKEGEKVRSKEGLSGSVIFSTDFYMLIIW